MCSNGSKSSDHSIKPVLAFDTRRDITSISWSHLRPDDIAVAFLFRPEIHIFDLGQIEEGNGPLGGAAEEPDKCLTVDGKGSSGHNIVLFWHDSKLQTQGNRVAVRTETEGVVAGSVSGYIRFWTTTLSNGASSNTKTCMWNLLADPHRSPLTACPVVSLLIVCSKNKSDSSGHSPLLLAATAQGVITLWDLSNMRPASFGSTAPEPSCVRRLEYTNHLMLFNSLTVVGATATEVSFCTFCKTKEDTRDHACNALQLEDRLLLFDTQDTAVQVLQNSKSTTGGTLHTYHATNNSSNSRNTKEVNHAAIGGSSHHLQQQKFHQQSASQESISTHLLLTLSSGDVAMVDLNTEKVVGCNKNRISSTTSAQYTLEGSSTAASTSSALAAASRKAAVSQNDPTRATVLSYEAIRRELSFQQEAAETG